MLSCCSQQRPEGHLQLQPKLDQWHGSQFCMPPGNGRWLLWNLEWGALVIWNWSFNAGKYLRYKNAILKWSWGTRWQAHCHQSGMLQSYQYKPTCSQENGYQESAILATTRKPFLLWKLRARRIAPKWRWVHPYSIHGRGNSEGIRRVTNYSYWVAGIECWSNLMD